ncbi:MAG TPA: transporter suffix domain-containing protein [Rubrobacteraceae bacterium]|nr:transporter suffix domain-containing protein [Rubrobacteraceae bacterium]
MKENEQMEAGGTEEREPARSPEPAGTPQLRKGWRVWVLVFGVIVVPTLLYLAIPAVPFLPLTTGQKVWVSAGLVVVAETVFLISALLIGREAVRRYRRYLDPRRWFGKG